MKITPKKSAISGGILLAGFLLWTALIRSIDVKPVGQKGTDIGFAAVNGWFHQFTGVNMTLYTVTDWLGLIPLLVCLIFAGIGLVQLVRRKSLRRVDADLLILGGYYIVVMLCYAFFEAVPINYRPVLINGVLEASYPSSTTLLVLGVMPTLAEQSHRRIENPVLRRLIQILTWSFSGFMVLGRLVCGVHWLTDIVGSVLLCAGLFLLYHAAVLAAGRNQRNGSDSVGIQ